MKKHFRCLAALALVASMGLAQAATITVTTTNATGVGSLNNAITALNNGDTIAFNIPGAGPHYIIPPFGGYPIITKNNITIDGYTQPGSSVNTNPILAANNAAIKIVIKGLDGYFTDLTALAIPGYTDGECALLAVIGTTNFTARGLCFLGNWVDTVSPLSQYAVALGGTALSVNANISGCRFGLDPNNTTVGRLKDGIPFFGAGASNLVVGVAAGPANAAAARAQFNIFVSMYISVIGNNGPVRMCGNFLNVYPNGLTDYNVNTGDGSLDHSMEAITEFGSNNGFIFGTDGDGLNDAEERNVVGGATAAGDSRIFEWYGTSPANTRTIIAGNYIGVGIDGLTRFTNGGPVMQLFESIKSTSITRIGSDFDGVSDAIEANIISWNFPFSTLYPDLLFPGLSSRWRFANIDAGAIMSLRGNVMIGNDPAPFTYLPEGLAGDSTRLEKYTNQVATFMSTAGDYNTYAPVLATTNVYPTLSGTFAVGIAPYTTVSIDVYELDPEGWANGKALAGAQNWPELTDGATYTNGFPQGKKYLGTFNVPNTGSFSITLPAYVGVVTATANYSADPAGTHNGRTATGNFSNPGYILPGGAASVGVTQIVPDVACWFDTVANTVTNGFINLANQPAASSLGNWEPFISKIGDSTFLVEFNTYANDGSLGFQNNAVAKQPAAGGPGKVDYCFYGDAGLPFKGQLNLSRQNGNPGKVGGDLRYGANKFITECEASVGQLPEFQSLPLRWTNNNIFLGSARYAAAQVFSWNPATLAQTPVTKAWEFVYGPYVGSMGAAADVTQVERTGGRPNFLDNGNIVVMIDDKAAIASPVGEVTTFAIIQPNGTVVKGPTLVDARNIFDNMCAVKGGFVVRVHQFLYFYNNSGIPTYTNNVNVSSGVNYQGSVGGLDGDRGDGHRIGGDVHSYYVYFAGKITSSSTASQIAVTAWDSRTGQFVGSSIVTDGDPTVQSCDRTDVAVDALNRVCVTYMYKPNGLFGYQAAARVAQFDGANFNWLTHSFFPFVNHDQNPTAPLGYITQNPVVAMNTRQICFAAKGMINSSNNVAAGPNTPDAQQTVYTVISHPAPVAAPVPTLSITKSGGSVNLTWNADDGLFTVQTRASLSSGSWVNATAENVAPPVNVGIGTGALFIRLVR